MVVAPRNVTIAGSGATPDRLAERYREAGAEVVRLPYGTELSGSGERPLDLLIIADEPEQPVGMASRADLAAAMQRLTYWPLHLAAKLRPRLAAAGGRIVLISSTAARMEHVDTTGAYLERPFRAAAHALWRCLSVEWKADDILCAVIALDPDRTVPLEQLSQAIEGVPDEAFPVELTDAEGTRLGW
jgi:NAD(P)-dependent dehydrogenase (short-subunit alcohol dehydrogenase family)